MRPKVHNEAIAKSGYMYELMDICEQSAINWKMRLKSNWIEIPSFSQIVRGK